MSAPAFRGWWIVLVAFLCQATSMGFAIISYGLFLTPVGAEFGASTMQTNLGVVALNLVMTGVGPVVGALLDRTSIRAVMTLGAVITAAGFALISIAGSLAQVGALIGVVAVGVAMMGPLSATTVVAKWFDRRRGQAVGFAAMGPPAGGLLLVPLAGVLLGSIGWRGTLQVYAGITLALAPLIWWVVRSTPGEIGQNADGAAPDVERVAAVAPAGPIVAATPVWSSGAILRSRAFWTLAVGIGIVFGFQQAWNANAPRFAEGVGYTTQQAALLLGVGAGLGIPGTLLFGALADRRSQLVLLWITIAIQAVCILVLRTEPGPALFVPAWLGIGFAAGGMLPVYAALLGRIFGPASFGRAMGMAGLVMLPFTTSAPLAGALRDASGSYASALLMIVIAFGVGAAVLGLVPVRTGRPAPDDAASE